MKSKDYVNHTLDVKAQRALARELSDPARRRRTLYDRHMLYIEFATFGVPQPVYINLLRGTSGAPSMRRAPGLQSARLIISCCLLRRSTSNARVRLLFLAGMHLLRPPIILQFGWATVVRYELKGPLRPGLYHRRAVRQRDSAAYRGPYDAMVLWPEPSMPSS